MPSAAGQLVSVLLAFFFLRTLRECYSAAFVADMSANAGNKWNALGTACYVEAQPKFPYTLDPKPISAIALGCHVSLDLTKTFFGDLHTESTTCAAGG